MKLEDLQSNAAVRGILPDAFVTVVSVQWFGSEALELTYKTPSGKVANELLYRHDEPRLEIVEQGRPWSFDGDGTLFRLVSEAQRIRLAHLFDPVLAVHTSVVEPLPHQITAVYEHMLPRQPLRFLLADDPGAGKTIMAGLLIKELIARGDLQRCLVVCPGSLAEQWQDELFGRFHLPFEILTNDKLEAARTGNWFLETNLIIARLDKLSRNEDVQLKLQAPDCRWDLVVCDEAHKMSATVFGGETKYTKRYRLGQLLSTLTRQFLLMTATPHNGKEADFQLFMALLDGDRFEGRYRDGVHATDVSDLMRRMVKESLLKFDGTPLFPERIAYTVPYKLSDAEANLYRIVTDYVREEFNRAEALENDKRAGTVGFALTILQRRLASSPEAIYQSLRRRRERLESRLRELELLQRGGLIDSILPSTSSALDSEDVEDLEDAPDNEVEAAEEEILDQATAARSIAELRIEIETLKGLEAQALVVGRSGTDTKWRELASLLGEILTPAGLATAIVAPHHASEPDAPYGAGKIPPPQPSPRQKLVIFTERRDTLNYLEQRISTLLGRKEAVVIIHGGIGREERLKVQESFKHDPEVQVLLATDAAGEGINLQRAHLMVNYDLPWNPNRIEQRFGRIHRIGQTEVCHLWNLVAEETREGDVYRKLLEKLEQARQALGGQVFDVLGRLQFEGKSLRELLIEAVRYGERPEVQAYLTTVLDTALDRDHLRTLLDERALAHDAMDASKVQRIRADMERADARRLQPHYIESFFHEAFKILGGSAKQWEARRYEITHVPAPVRNCDRLIGITEVVVSDEGEVSSRRSSAPSVCTTRARRSRARQGKLTTAPEQHTGEGIFFTSRALDFFEIESHHLRFSHAPRADDSIAEQAVDTPGTRVRMRLVNDSPRRLREVFDAFTDPEEYSFDKTIVPLRLAQYEGEKLVSRSQAKRVANRFERFKRVELDFAGVAEIGQAFADELFRVFAAGASADTHYSDQHRAGGRTDDPPCRGGADTSARTAVGGSEGMNRSLDLDEGAPWRRSRSSSRNFWAGARSICAPRRT